MEHSRKEEDLGGFTLSQLLALKPAGGGVAPVWHPNGKSIYFQTSMQDKKSLLSINLNILSYPLSQVLQQTPKLNQITIYLSLKNVSKILLENETSTLKNYENSKKLIKILQLNTFLSWFFVNLLNS